MMGTSYHRTAAVPGAATGQRQHHFGPWSRVAGRKRPARFDELDKQQAGTLIAKLRRHGHVPANHRLGGPPPRRQDTD